MPRDHRTSEFQPSFGLNWRPVLPREQLAGWDVERLQRYLKVRKDTENSAIENPVGFGWSLPMWDTVQENFNRYRVHAILGGNRCLRGDTEIFDPVLGISRRIDSIYGPHHVYAWDGSKLVIAEATEPFTKPAGAMVRVVLSTGESFVAALEHRVKSQGGEWVSCGELKVGDELLKPQGLLGRVSEITQEGEYVKWDMSVPVHENYLAAGVIHHNSSKSIFASRLAVWAASVIPEAQIRMYHVNEQRSIQDQQQMVYDALPLVIKNLPTKKGANHSITFSQKNGFTDSICILPKMPGYRKGSSIFFGNYRQYQQDEQVAEGFKAHLILLDEECPQKLFETLLFRTIDLDGKIILTFTTLQGWTPLIQDLLGKTKTLMSTEAPLLDNMKVPLMQESLSRKNTAIYFFHTSMNPFIDSASFLETLKGRPKDEVLARAYGIPTKSFATVFPAFNKQVNVVKHEELPWIKNPNYKVTRYMAIDPGGSKSWFAVWVAVDARGTWWIYREYPDDGDWALPGNTVEGKPGPAAKGRGLGIKDYVELFTSMEKEGNEEIMERYIDPRMGAAERQSQDGATTIISDLDQADMVVIPAPGVDIENGLQLLNNLLAWDETKPRDSVNSPRLYISDRCQNVIYGFSEFTNKGGSGEACKDGVDCCRYLAVSNIEFIDMTRQTHTQTYGKTGSY